MVTLASSVSVPRSSGTASAFIARGPGECPYVFLSLRGLSGHDGDCLVATLE